MCFYTSYLYSIITAYEFSTFAPCNIVTFSLSISFSGRRLNRDRVSSYTVSAIYNIQARPSMAVVFQPRNRLRFLWVGSVDNLYSYIGNTMTRNWTSYHICVRRRCTSFLHGFSGKMFFLETTKIVYRIFPCIIVHL